MDKYTNERVKRALKKFLKKAGKDYLISKAILFGSRAREEHFLDSDADVLIVSKDFEGKIFIDRITNLLDFWDEQIDLEILPYTPEEFEKKKKQIGIVQQAVKERIKIK